MSEKYPPRTVRFETLVFTSSLETLVSRSFAERSRRRRRLSWCQRRARAALSALSAFSQAIAETPSSIPRVVRVASDPLSRLAGLRFPRRQRMSPETARSPSTPVFAFGDEARATGRRRRPRAAHDGFTSGARSEDEEGDFELESFPLTSLALGPWHARAHVSLRLAFGSGRFVFVVVRRLRAKKASAFGRTAELVTRHVARRLHVDVPMSPFDLVARGRRKTKGGDRATSHGKTDEDEDENVSDDGFFKRGKRAKFAEGKRDDVSRNVTHGRRRRPRPTKTKRHLVLTYEIEHEDIVGLNYVNQLCLDGRLAIEARRVTKRAFDALDDALAFFAARDSTTTDSAPAAMKPTGADAASVSVSGVSFDGRRRLASAAGIGRAGARRNKKEKVARDAFASPTFSARKRSRFAADSLPDAPPRQTAEKNFPPDVADVLDAETSDAPSPRTPPRDDEPVAPRNDRKTSAEDPFREKKTARAPPFAFSRRRVEEEAVLRDPRDTYASTLNDFSEVEVFRDQTVFASFDDLFLPEALRERVVAERRLLTLAEDGIPIWATVMASCGLWYRPWLRAAFRAAFIALALGSAFDGARDFFALGARGGESQDADVAPASSKTNTLFFTGLYWTGGARLGLVDARALRTLTSVLNELAKALARVFTFVGYVVGRVVSHRLSLAMAARRAWRKLPGMWANAHGFEVASHEPLSVTREFGISDDTKNAATGNTSDTTSGGDFRAETFASPRLRKNKTPARGAPTSQNG